MNACLLLKVNVLITKHRLTFQFSYWALFEWLWTSRKKVFEIWQNKTTERIKIICDFIKRGDEKLLSDWQAPLGVMTSYHNEYIFVATKKILCCSYWQENFPYYKFVRTQQSNYNIQLWFHVATLATTTLWSHVVIEKFRLKHFSEASPSWSRLNSESLG